MNRWGIEPRSTEWKARALSVHPHFDPSIVPKSVELGWSK